MYLFVMFVFVQQIRKEMIDAQTGSYTIETLVKSQDEVNLIVEFIVMMFKDVISNNIFS